MSMRYIGIDAGGTKTELLLSDEKGKQLRRALLPGVNAARMPVEQAAEALARGVAHLGGAADCLYAGIAGAGTPELARALRQEMEKRLPEVKRMEVASDAFNAMNGEIGLENGLALIAGTGSSAFLRTEDGVLQIGGRGPLIDDGGSGYSVGRAVLNAAYRAMDGRGPQTTLVHAAEKRLGVPLREAIPRIYAGGVAEIAGFGPLAAECAQAGDAVAREIAEDCARELALHVTAALARVPAGRLICVCSGGVFRSAYLRELFLKRIPEKRVQARFPEKPPVCGAVKTAALMNGQKDFEIREELPPCNTIN